MSVASELGIATVCIVIAAALLYLGRMNSERLSRSAFLFVTFPAIVLIFVSIAGISLLSMFLR